MALLGFEGFDDTPTNSPADETLGTGQNAGTPLGLWSLLAGTCSKVTGFNAGSSALLPGTTANVQCALNANYTRLILGFRFLTAVITSLKTSDLIVFYSDANQQLGISINSSGFIYVWRGTPSTVLATGTTALTGTSWYYLEIDVTFNSSSGSFTLRLNGTGTEASASGVNTGANNQCNIFGMKVISTFGLTSAYDDLYLLDPTTGSSPFTSMLGVCRVESLAPNSTSSAGPWTLGAGSSLSAAVSQTASDADTTYDVTATTGQMTLGHASLSSTPATIFAAAVKAIVRKDQTSSPAAQTTLISGGTTQQGAAYGQATSYLTMRDIYIHDPNTGSPWTISAINSSTIGVNRTL